MILGLESMPQSETTRFEQPHLLLLYFGICTHSVKPALSGTLLLGLRRPTTARPCPCRRPSVVTEGYRGSRPLPPTPPAKTCQPGRNLGRTWGEPGGNLGETVRSMGFRFFLAIFLFLFGFLFVFCRMLGQHSLKRGQPSPKMAQPSAQDGPT